MRVTLSVDPSEQARPAAGSVYTPASWSITRTDTGFIYDILEISKVANMVYDVFTLEILGDSSVQHSVRTVGLLDAGGWPI